MPPTQHLTLAAILLTALPVHAAPDAKTAAAALENACIDCHNGKKSKGGVDLERLMANPQFEAEFALWEKVAQVVKSGEMPPEDADALLPAEKTALVNWVSASLTETANRNAGDPGPVTLRRLTNYEYDRTLRDLTGHDFQLSVEFQPDGGGGEGFSNIGDVLFVSPQQLDKYLKAARTLADHATVLPGTGIKFHPQRIGLRGAKQVKDQAEQALYIWYQKAAAPHLPKDGEDFREADYMLACWKWRHKEVTGAQSLEQLARDASLSLPFLENWWNLLSQDKVESRFLDLTCRPWRELPGPAADRPREVPPAVTQALAAIQAQRRSWLGKKDPGSGVQRRQQDADGLRSYSLGDPLADAPPQNPAPRQVYLVLGDLGDSNRGDFIQISNLTLKIKGKPQEYVGYMGERLREDRDLLAQIEGGAPPPPGTDLAALKQRIQAVTEALDRFGKDPLGATIPPATLAAQAPAVIPLPLPEGATSLTGSGRLDLSSPDADHATAQWTLVLDNPPDPTAIIPGVLTVWKRQTQAQRATMGDFNRMKAAFPDVFERRLEEVADNLHRNGAAGPGIYYLSDRQLSALLPKAEQNHLRDMHVDWSFVSPARLKPEQTAAYHTAVRGHLHRFAERAWRRPLSQDERARLTALYDSGCAAGQSPETAAREVIVRTLISPFFLYKAETLPAEPLAGAAPATEAPLSAWQLASRLSYFLWSSLPDWLLRQAAADGSLLRPEVLHHHVQRMLRDPKSAALASQFAGQWLEFALFEEKTIMDADKFPEFTPELRAAMAAETRHFFENLIRQDRPVRDILLADYTYLNEDLARHYGIPGVTGAEFRQVSVQEHSRGGLLGMGSILAKTSRPHRTSPVLRGNWLLSAVLGTPVPPPPNDVPELQEHPDKPASLRAQLEQHRADPACASCHNRIDPLGFALERFDPIGRLREKDDLGQPLDTTATLPGGARLDGFAGLRAHLAAHEEQFTRLFARKLTAYALGRPIQPTDTALIGQIQQQLGETDTRFSAAVLAIVDSRQFRHRRLD